VALLLPLYFPLFFSGVANEFSPDSTGSFIVSILLALLFSQTSDQASLLPLRRRRVLHQGLGAAALLRLVVCGSREGGRWTGQSHRDRCLRQRSIQQGIERVTRHGAGTFIEEQERDQRTCRQEYGAELNWLAAEAYQLMALQFPSARLTDVPCWCDSWSCPDKLHLHPVSDHPARAQQAFPGTEPILRLIPPMHDRLSHCSANP
jgi:hypothetical protein